MWNTSIYKVPLPAATAQEAAPRVPFDVFLKKLQWEAGEHVAICGTTGSGKTVLLTNLLKLRAFNVVFATKPRDDTMDNLIENEEFKKYEAWKQEDPDKHPNRVIWPDASQIGAVAKQQQVFADAFDKIYREGGWNVWLDESWYITNKLRLENEIEMYLLQARSLGISLIQATQRPVSVPVATWDQSTHLFLYRENDLRNLERVSGIAWRDSRHVRELVANLEKHQFLYVNTRTGQMFRSRAPVPRSSGGR